MEVWEAVLTFLFFPILILVAYAADKGWLNILFCQSPAKLTDKQRQIELGAVAPGECKYLYIFRTYQRRPSASSSSLTPRELVRSAWFSRVLSVSVACRQNWVSGLHDFLSIDKTYDPLSGRLATPPSLVRSVMRLRNLTGLMEAWDDAHCNTNSLACISVTDPYVFGPPGSGSGFFNQQAKIVRKTLTPTVIVTSS